jgi:N-ethylmaleimide reductase
MTMLFDAFTTRSLVFKNRAVMAPMTRSRAVGANTANALMAEYYGQRASAGLILTEERPLRKLLCWPSAAI